MARDATMAPGHSAGVGESGQVNYRHRQVAWATVIGFAAGVVTEVGALLWNLRRGRRRRALFSVPWMLSLIPSMALFSWLDTEGGDDVVVVSFKAGGLRRGIPLGG